MISDAIKDLCAAKGMTECLITYLEDVNCKAEKEVCVKVCKTITESIEVLEEQMYQMKYLREQLEDATAKIDAKHAKA